MYPHDAYPEQLLATAQDRIREQRRALERREWRAARRDARRAARVARLRRALPPTPPDHV